MRFMHISKKGLVLFLIIITVIAGLSGTSYIFYMRMQELQKIVQDPQAITREEVRSITSKLSSLMVLPKDEEPTIATILDKEKIKDPFFNKAENGDKLLVFAKSGKALLYRPRTNKVIDFGVVNLSTPSAAGLLPVRVAIYNGTTDEKSGEKLADDLKAKVTNIEVVTRQSARKTDYEKTLVVDMTAGAKGDLAKQMADLIKGTVVTMPEGEIKPATVSGQIDLLIIVGTDYGK